MTLRGFAVLLVGAAGILRGDPSQCARCHPKQTAQFEKSGMFLALRSGAESNVLASHPRMGVTLTPYEYRIDGGYYTVSRGQETLRVPLNWAFGQGSTGQTWAFNREGRWYESRVSYFGALGGLDVTLGAESIPVHGIDDAAGRPIAPVELSRCFGCHATNVAKMASAGEDPLKDMIPGIQCERCHGPSERHVAAKASMRALGKFTTEEMSDFCGQCHRTWSDISLNGPRGIRNVRFQPYRIATAKCYDPTDERISCVSCHDPHRPRETVAAFYDSKCVSCHSRTAKATPAARRVCRVSGRNCVECHMPLVELPGSHRKFTDHRIRVARAGDAYPD